MAFDQWKIKTIYEYQELLNINLSTNIIDSDKGFNDENGDVFVNLKVL